MNQYNLWQRYRRQDGLKPPTLTVRGAKQPKKYRDMAEHIS